MFRKTSSLRASTAAALRGGGENITDRSGREKSRLEEASAKNWFIFIYIYIYFFFTLLLSSFWTSHGHRCRPFSPPVLAFRFHRA